MNPFIGILIFSLVETLAVVLWAKLVFAPEAFIDGPQTAGIIVLFVFYVVEHILAHNNGKNRPLFSFPKP